MKINHYSRDYTQVGMSGVDVFEIPPVVPAPAARCDRCPTILRKGNKVGLCSVCLQKDKAASIARDRYPANRNHKAAETEVWRVS